MSQINVSITQKLMAMAGAILLLAGGAQVYLAYEIDLSDEVINGVIDEQALILARLHTIQATANQFGDMRYWLTDLAVSWQNESEENAEAALESLQTLLGELESTDREVVAAIRPLIQQFHDVMIEAVDAYVDDNRVLGNSKVADGRAHVVTVNNELRQILTAADEQAKNATQALTLNNSALLFTALIGLAVAFVIGSMLTWLCARAISRPLIRAVGVAKQISEGMAMPFTPVSIDGMLAGWSLKNTPYRASIILGLSRSSTSGSLVRRTVKVISETYVGRMASSVLTVERAASRG